MNKISGDTTSEECQDAAGQADDSSRIVEKSRKQILWNWFRARLPVLLLAALLLLVEPVWKLWSIWGVPLLLMGQGLRSWAVGYLHKDRELASTGPYAFCRHPLYLGTFLSSMGVCLLVGSLAAAAVFTAIFTVVYIPTIRQEDSFLENVYGQRFRDYAAEVPAFLPRLCGAKSNNSGYWNWQRLLANEEHLTWGALIIFLLAMAAKHRFL